MAFYSSKNLGVFFLIAAIAISTVSFQNCSKIQSAGNQNHSSSLSDMPFMQYTILNHNNLESSFQSDIDDLAPNCASSVLSGYKCLDRKITTSEGKTYGVRLKWNRAGKISRGSFISIGGGAGTGEALSDATFKKIIERIDTEDHVRAIFVEFMDAPSISKDWGGCWSKGGGYRSAGLLFRDVVAQIVDDLKIPRGDFLNYLGLSNGSMLVSYGMSNFKMDSYFNRVVLHAGPVLADAIEACDSNNPKSIIRTNTKEKSDYLINLFSQWLNGDSGPNFCSSIQSDDRMSVLGSKRSFPNTHIVTVIGDLEDKPGGFGSYHKISNEDWFNKISAKSKIRIVPEFMGHHYSYSNIRRFLKAGKNDMVQNDVDCPDQVTEVCEGNTVFKHVRLACTLDFTDYIMQGAGYSKVETDHYKVSLNRSCGAPPPPQSSPTQTNCASVGQFTNQANGDLTAYKCNCPIGKDMSGWTNVGGGCYHKVIQAGAQPATKAFQFIGGFYGDGLILTRREVKIIGAGANAKVCLGRYSVSANSCVNESEFVFQRDRMGLGGYYDANSDTYFISENIFAYNFPYEKYYAVYILSDGTRRRVELQPTYENSP